MVPAHADILVMAKPVSEPVHVSKIAPNSKPPPIPRHRPEIMRVPDNFLKDRGYNVPKPHYHERFQALSARDVLEEVE